MPVLGFEKHRGRKSLTHVIEMVHSNQKIEEKTDAALLIEGYLQAEKALHCRRTLDQFAYYMLETTASRDKDQVTYRWARKERKKDSAGDRPILMVDQLWLWALHDGCRPIFPSWHINYVSRRD
jgi:hypothetical protein